ncbi:thioesterase family protein [Pseudactinotalea sp. HY158]|uniref:acyl-CoA thioesterase n=1 Tax=Pseudactinotalea sp. HY158 TaxID=2654547 RepID=UPI00129CD197|nr:thioesterase family protein [Pseudactinotalea sp. HY158]QGH70130.1 acyl-CoA thioesterase [Pseudactinotalea sp. HY158]
MAKITVPIRMRWSDLDAYGHVNNAAMLTLLEEARIETFWTVDTAGAAGVDGAAAGADEAEGPGPDDSGSKAARRVAKVLAGGTGSTSRTLVARQEIEYSAPLAYTQRPVPVDLWIGRIGGASLEVCYEVFSPDGTSCARAVTSIVMVDAGTGRPRRLSADERAALTALLDEPVTFRRRT